MSTIYHLVPDNMTGTRLLPLNKLREAIPDVYESAVEKYNDHPSRLGITNRQIPLLSCTWGDVLQFSPIHPHLIANAMAEAGMTVPNWDFFEIPVEKVHDLSAVMFYGMEQPPTFHLISWELYRNLDAVLNATVRWYEQLAHRHRSGAVFNGIPHVMVRGQVSVVDCERIKMKP